MASSKDKSLGISIIIAVAIAGFFYYLSLSDPVCEDVQECLILRSDKEDLMNERNDLKQENNLLENQLNDKTLQISSLTEEKKEITKQLQTASDNSKIENDNLKEQPQILQANVTSLETENTNLKTQIETSNGNQTDTTALLRDELFQKENIIINLNQTITNQSTEITNLNNIIDILNKTDTGGNNTLAEEIVKLKEENNNLKNQIDDLKNQPENTVTKSEKPSSKITTSNSSMQVNQSIQFNANQSTDDTGIKSYQWYVDGNHTSSDSNFDYVFTTSGKYLITLEVIDEDDQSDIDFLTITIEPNIQETRLIFSDGYNVGGKPLNDSSSGLFYSFNSDLNTMNVEYRLRDADAGKTFAAGIFFFYNEDPGSACITEFGMNGFDKLDLDNCGLRNYNPYKEYANKMNEFFIQTDGDGNGSGIFEITNIPKGEYEVQFFVNSEASPSNNFMFHTGLGFGVGTTTLSFN